jgi:NhaP-type Na+/H+ or K+/H+ antiporter
LQHVCVSSDSYIIIITIIGVAALGMAWMPALTRYTKISYSILYVIAGMLLYLLLGNLLPLPNPISEGGLTLRLTELVILISLMGSGLKIDQPFSLRTWAVPFRLISITMLLSILIVTLAGYYLLGLPLSSALLLGAVLAPTDPVLASDVQVGPPMEDAKDNIKFGLTAEAGMNDGTAFPFTWLAILLATAATTGQAPDLQSWLWSDLLYKLAAGAAAGFLLGRLLALLLFTLPEKIKEVETRDGFVAISATLLVYGVTEMIHGYGFIAVFVSAITLRNYELHHKYHKRLHAFTDQIERILVAIVLLLFGGSIVKGLMNQLNWPMIFFGLSFVLLIRPLTSLIGLIGIRLHRKEKLAISFFGIKGIGSFFYLSFAITQAQFQKLPQLWSLTAFIVLMSIIIHGLTATSVMQKLEGEFTRSEPVEEVKE